MAGFFDSIGNFLGGGALQGAQAIGGELNQFSAPVQNFVQRATQSLQQGAQNIANTPLPQSVQNVVNEPPIFGQIRNDVMQGLGTLQQHAAQTPVLPFQAPPLPGSWQLPKITPQSMMDTQIPGSDIQSRIEGMLPKVQQSPNPMILQQPNVGQAFLQSQPLLQVLPLAQQGIQMGGRLLGLQPTPGDLLTLATMKFGPEIGSRIVNTLGSDAYTFLANKDLIRDVVTGKGTPEQMKQWNILNQNDLPVGELTRGQGTSIQASVPKTGPVWDMLRAIFPDHFNKTGNPNSDFTDPEKSPLALPGGTVPNAPEVSATTNPLKIQEAPPSPLERIQKFGSDLVNPDGIAQGQTKIQQSIQNQPAFHAVLDAVAKQQQTRAFSNVKPLPSMFQKIIEHREGGETNYGISDINDGLRGTVVIDNPEKLTSTLDSLRQEIAQKGMQITKEQNFFEKPQAGGYEGYHVDVRMPDGQTGEIQIHTPHTLANAEVTHSVYDLANGNLPKVVSSKLQSIQGQIKEVPSEQADVTAQAYIQQQAKNGQILSPMESNYSETPKTQALAEAAANASVNPSTLLDQTPTQTEQMLKVLKEKNPQLDYSALEKIANEPKQQELAQQQMIQNHYLNNLTRQRDAVKARFDQYDQQLQPASPELQNMVKIQSGIQDEVQAAKNVLNRYTIEKGMAKVQGEGVPIMSKKDIQAHIADLNKSLKVISDQVDSEKLRLKSESDQGKLYLRSQLETVNKQIADEQARLGVGQAVQAEKVKIANAPQAPVQQAPTQQVPIAQSPQVKVLASQPTAPQVTSTADVGNVGKVLSFSPVEGGRAKVGTALEFGFTPSGNSKGMWEDNQGNQYQAKFDATAENNYKKESGLPTLSSPDRLYASKRVGVMPSVIKPKEGLSAIYNTVLNPLQRSLAGSSDIRARQIAYGVKDALDWYNYKANTSVSQLAAAREKLSPEDYQNATLTLENKATANNQEVQKWVSIAKGITKDIADLSKKAGVTVRDDKGGRIPFQALDDYFPHWRTKNQIEAMAQDPDTIAGVIHAGLATNPDEASSYIRRAGKFQTARFGSLEEHRFNSPVPYIQDPRILEDYAEQAYHRIATTSVFGSNTEKAAQLSNAMLADGNRFDANASQQLLKATGMTYQDGKSPEEEAFGTYLGAVRTAEAFSKLGFLTPVHHGTTLAGLAGRLGTGNVIRSLPEGVNALIGKFSDEAKTNINFLRRRENSELYGRPTSAMNTFFNVIGLNKTLEALSAIGNKAALYRINDLEGKLNTPEAERDILHAGLDLNAIQKRGYFTPEEKSAYVTAALKDSSLFMAPEEMPKMYNSTIGKLLMMFKGPTVQRTFELYPYLLNEAKSGRISPLIAFLALSTLIGGAYEQVTGNLLQNRPAQTPEEIAKEGLLRGAAPLGGEELASYMQYPQFGASTVAGILGGPLASDAVSLSQVPGLLKSQNLTDVLSAKRQLVRMLPLVGPTAANTFLPYQSYVGNRPTDILKVLSSGNEPQPLSKYNTSVKVQHTLMDLVRANPIVAEAQKVAGDMFKSVDKITSQLTPGQQNTLQTVDALLQAPYNEGNANPSWQSTPGNALSKVQGYGILQNDPTMALAKSQIEIASAKANNMPVNPLWALGVIDPTAQKIVLQYKGLLPEDQKLFKSDPQNAKVLNIYNAAVGEYYNQIANNPNATTFEKYGITAPTASQEVSNLLNEAKLTKNYNLYNDPRVQQYFGQLDYYNNYINGLAGLPGGGSGSSGGSSSGSSNYMENYLKRQMIYDMLKTPTAPAQVKIRPMATGSAPDPLKAYYANQDRIMAQISKMPAIQGMPKLKAPTIKAPPPLKFARIGQ